MNDQYLNRKSGTLQNMQFEMFNNLCNDNIILAKDMFLTDTHDIQEDPNEYHDYEDHINSKSTILQQVLT